MLEFKMRGISFSEFDKIGRPKVQLSNNVL